MSRTYWSSEKTPLPAGWNQQEREFHFLFNTPVWVEYQRQEILHQMIARMIEGY